MNYKDYRVNRGVYHDHQNGGVVCGCCLAETEHRNKRRDGRFTDGNSKLYREVRSDAKPKVCWSCAAMVDETIYQEKQTEVHRQAEQDWMDNNTDAWYNPDN